MGVTFISDEVATDDNGITAAAAVGNNAAFTLGGALASGGTVTFASARKVEVTAGGDDRAIAYDITGTDLRGNVQTERLTGGNSAATVTTAFFKTVTAITAVGDPAGNPIAGTEAAGNIADVVLTTDCRLKGFSIVSGGTAGVVEFRKGSETGTILFKARTLGTDNTTVDHTIPGDGVLFEGGCYVTYTVATIDMMTFYFN
jgi:hypothetical protein